jgi:hypothetical protein
VHAMNTGRSLIIGCILTTMGPAWAADLGPDGLVELVPPGPVTGGGPPVELFVLALEPDGSPVLGAKLKSARTVGMDRTWTEVGGGVYKIAFQPPEVISPSAIDVTVRGKSRATKTKLTLDQAIELRPPAAPVSGEANLPSLLLGRDPETTITISGTSEAGTRVRTSAGEIGDVDVLPGGGAAVRFEPPAVQFPHAAIVVFADEARPLERRGHLVLKLIGNAAYPVKASPGAAVSLQVGDKVYGPVTADASGTAKIPVEVPPGITTATQISVVNGQEARAPLDLQVPQPRRLALFPLPLDLPADPAVTVPIRAVVVDGSGNPDLAAQPAFEVPGGTLGEVRHLGDGVYEAAWTLPEEAGAGTVRVGLGSEVQADAIDVTLVHPRAATVVVTPQVEEIGAATEEVPVIARLTDAGGRPIVGAKLVVEPEHAELVGEIDDRGNGDYGFALAPADEGEVGARVVVTSGTSRSPVALVVVVPRAVQVATGAEAGTDVVVATLDSVGLPVPGVTVKLAAEGEGRIEPAEVVTGRDGTAVVRFAGAAEADLTRLVATAGGATGAGVVLAAPADVAPVAIPPEAAARGAGALPAGVGLAGFVGVGLPLSIPRAAAPGGGVWAGGDAAAEGPSEAEAQRDQPAEAADEGAGDEAQPEEPAAPAASLKITAEPATVAPGSTLTVTASRVGGAPAPDAASEAATAAETAEGAATADPGGPPELVVTGGVVESMTTGEDGVVTAVVKVADDATGTVEIVATSGALSRTLSVAVDAPADPWASPAPEAVAAAPVPAPAAPEPVAAPSPPPAPSSFRWLRARVAGVGSLYRYEQSPTDVPGPLLPQRLSVGGPGGGSAAQPLGGELAVRAWGDPLNVPYVGVSGQVRLAAYSITSAEFNGPARDALTNIDLSLVGRYPLDLGDDRYWAGPKVGFLYGDFMLFTGCLEPSCTVNFLPVPVPGLGTGAEIGADVGALSVVGGYTLGLARGTQPYAHLVDLDGAYEVADHITANLGLSVMSRTVTLQGQDSGLARGSLTDAQMMARVGMGFAL